MLNTTRLAASLVFLFGSSVADASILGPVLFNNNGSDVITPNTLPQETDSDNSNPNESKVQQETGYTDDLELLMKFNVEGGEEGGLDGTGLYNIVFSNSPSDPADALVTWLGGLTLSTDYLFMVVKDGNHNPAVYFFNISKWDRKATFSLEGFWPDGGAISNVAIWGGDSSQTATSAPEATSIVTWLGILAVGCVGLRRRQVCSTCLP